MIAVVSVAISVPPVSDGFQFTPWTKLDCPDYSMELLGVYYTILDTGGLGADGFTVTMDRSHDDCVPVLDEYLK